MALGQTARPVPHCPNPSMKHNRVAFSIPLSLSAPSLPFAGHIPVRPGCLLITQRGSICSHPWARPVKSLMVAVFLPARLLHLHGDPIFFIYYFPAF